MQTFVVTVICIAALILFFLVAYSIGYGDCVEDNEQLMQAYTEEIDMLKDKIKFFENVGPNKPTKEEKLDEVDQMVELFGYQGSKKARGDE